MKKATVIFLTVAIITAALMLGAASPFEDYAYKAILDTPMHKEASLDSEVLIEIPKNALMELIKDENGDEIIVTAGNTEWQFVKYTNMEGYVIRTAIYRSLKNEDYDVILAKAKSSKMGEKIVLYETHSVNTSETLEIYDGAKLRIIDNGIDYGEFYMVEYGGEYLYCLKTNVTTGLSYNQRLAVIITSCFIGAGILAFVIVVLIRRKKRMTIPQ